jgi:sigma-B regulation protein RsbU (phosphoserine phosphatase)
LVEYDNVRLHPHYELLPPWTRLMPQARQILLLSDNPHSLASLEGALAGGEFHLQPVATQVSDDRLTALLGAADAAIVDATAPDASASRIEPMLTLLDRQQVGAILLTHPQEGQQGSTDTDFGSMALVWPIPFDRLELIRPALRLLTGYQKVVSHLHNELRLYRRMDSQLRGRFSEIDEEMRLASRIQQNFLPKRLPAVGPAQFATLFRPASWVSGDLYDVFRLDEKHVGFYVTDAVGHGMPAALLTMFIKRSMETKHVVDSGYRLLGPDETMQSLNRALLDAAGASSHFTTAVYAVLNVQTLQLSFARGGHPHPIWLHADGQTSEPQADGGLLGVLDDVQFDRCVIQLSPGDKFLLYSDGLEMVFDDDQAGAEVHYRRHIEQARNLPIDQMLANLVERMDRQSGSLHPRDDITVVGLEIAAA